MIKNAIASKLKREKYIPLKRQRFWLVFLYLHKIWFIGFPLLLHSLAVGANGTDLSLWNLTSLLKILNAKFQNENPRKSF